VTKIVAVEVYQERTIAVGAGKTVLQGIFVGVLAFGKGVSCRKG